MLRSLRRAPHFRALPQDLLAAWEPCQRVQLCSATANCQLSQASTQASHPVQRQQQQVQQWGLTSLQPMQGKPATHEGIAAREYSQNPLLRSWPVRALVAGAASVRALVAGSSPVRALATATSVRLVRATDQSGEDSRGKNSSGGSGSGRSGWKSSTDGSKDSNRAGNSSSRNSSSTDRTSTNLKTSSSTRCRSSNEGSSQQPQPCPLHACLLRYDITDLAAFSAPKHLALSQEVVSSNVEPKLAALAAEGLSPEQMAQLLGRKINPILRCSYPATFLPNLQLLQQIACHAKQNRDPYRPELTTVGKALLVSSAGVGAQYLSRDPVKVQQLLQWLEGSLGVGLEQMAACKPLCHALIVSAGAANAVSSLLQQQQVSAGQVARMLLRQPTAFGFRPKLLSARLGALQQHLGLDAAAALQTAIAHPQLLTVPLESSLPPLLRFLDGYMGEEGAGRRLVCARPSLGGLTAIRAERSAGSLAARGYDRKEIQAIISKDATLLSMNLASPLQRQKLDWVDRISPWTLANFLGSPRYLTPPPGAWRGGWLLYTHVSCRLLLRLRCWQHIVMPGS